MRLHLAKARLRGLEFVVARIDPVAGSGRAVRRGPAVDQVLPGEVVPGEECGRGAGGRGALAGMVGREQRKDAVQPREVFLLNFGNPLTT